MKKLIMICVVVGVILAANSPGLGVVQVPIDPDTGWSGYFAWNDGIGPMDDISLVEGTFDWVETEWSVTMPIAGWITLVTAYDGYVVGDEFALYVDGALTPWTNEYYDGSGYYHGEYDNLFLSAATHPIYMYVTALAPGFDSGAAMADFSPVTYIPAPGAILLGGIGVGLVGWLRRRRTL